MIDVTHCKAMIAHYTKESTNWTKPASWHALARMSKFEWEMRLERVLAGEAI